MAKFNVESPFFEDIGLGGSFDFPVVTKTEIVLRAKDFNARLVASPECIAEYKNDILNSPDADIAQKWLHVALSKDPTATISISERPSWCASKYKNLSQYRKEAQEFRSIFAFKHFLTFEAWSSEEGWSLEFYDKLKNQRF